MSDSRAWTGGWFIQPHPDDIALSLGGTVALTRSPRIVTLFAAPPARDAPLSALARRWHERWGTDLDTWTIRQREDAAAASVLGARCEWLPYCDAIYRGERYLTAESLTGPLHAEDWPLVDQIAADLIARWREAQGATIYLPLGVGGHVDHQLAHALGAPLTAAGAAVRYYEDFPYAMVDGAVEDRLRSLRAGGGDARELVPHVLDVSAALERRLAAIAAYRSQIGVLFRPEGSYPGPYDHAVRRYAAGVAPDGASYGERTWAKARPGERGVAASRRAPGAG
ncbi:MAG TPA: PIG-L family deacetylase [Kofleriaceae bacterium]|nr:PIG-L family deacetylase [Kofleriaceae bacterium]